MDDTIIPKKSTEWNISWKKTCGKTTAKMGRQYQEGLLVAAAYKRRLAGDRNIRRGRETTEEVRARWGLSSHGRRRRIF